MKVIVGVISVLFGVISYVRSQGCVGNPCFNGGTCSDAGNGQFTCTCPDGYVGVVCESININAGICATNPCLNGGSCQVQQGDAFRCICTSNFDGMFCQNALGSVATSAPTDHPICNPNPCDNGGVCSYVNNTFNCACQPGFVGTFCHQALTAAPTGPTTTRNSLCDQNPCDNGGTCSSSGSGFSSTFSCACAPGFSGLFCHIGAGGVTTAYPVITTSTSHRICSPNPCDNGGTCSSTDGSSFSCACAPGYMGTFCHQVDTSSGVQVTVATTTVPRLCNPNPCDNGGICSANDSSSFTCQCVNGYTGTFCHTAPAICSPNPCANGGVCGASSSGSFDCTCAPGYTGFFCQAATAGAVSVPTPAPVPASCSNTVTKLNLGCRPAEVIFLLGHGPQDIVDHQGDFIRFLANAWTLGVHSMRVGVVTYADTPIAAVNITDFQDDKAGLLGAVGALTSNLVTGGGSDLAAALNYVRLNSFTNARPGVPRVVVSIINQTPTDASALAALVTVADALKQTCAVLIGEYVIGSPTNVDLVEKLVSQPYVDYYNYFSSYTALESSGLRFDANSCSNTVL